jgi:hypothetical protein
LRPDTVADGVGFAEDGLSSSAVGERRIVGSLPSPVEGAATASEINGDGEFSISVVMSAPVFDIASEADALRAFRPVPPIETSLSIAFFLGLPRFRGEPSGWDATLVGAVVSAAIFRPLDDWRPCGSVFSPGAGRPAAVIASGSSLLIFARLPPRAEAMPLESEEIAEEIFAPAGRSFRPANLAGDTLLAPGSLPPVGVSGPALFRRPLPIQE